MPSFRPTILTAALALCSFAASGSVPSTVSPDVQKAIDRAEQAIEDGEYQFALALYEGALYSGGITFGIDEDTVDDADNRNAVYFALGTWASELNGEFPVFLTDEENDPEVVLSFVDEIEGRGADALGLIVLRKNYRWNDFRHEVTYSGTIQIVRSAPGGSLSSDEILDVVMHEFGHLLGLGDVSDVGVLMGPLERGKPLLRPTEREVEHILELREDLRQKIAEVTKMAKRPLGTSGEAHTVLLHAVHASGSN